MIRDDDDRQLYAEAILGRQADIWWQTDIGRYVIARSKAEVDDAVSQLKEIACSEWQKILELQTKCRVAEAALVWLQEAIEAGNESIVQLEERNEIAGG